MPTFRATATAKNSKWFKVQNQADTDLTEVFIYDAIDDWEGYSANDLISQLRDTKTSHVKVHLNSPGGDAFQGLAIFNCLKSLDAFVTVEVDGMAASAGSIIAMAGDEIVMSEGAMMMIHQPWTMTYGASSDLRQTADFLDKLGAALADIYANRAGGDPADWSELMDAETWFNGPEAVAAGLADGAKGANKRSASAANNLKSGLISNDTAKLVAELETINQAVKNDTAPNSPNPTNVDSQTLWESLLNKVKQ